jgi:putative ABC transport system permease protein
VRLPRFLRRRAWDEERARELQAYLEQETADNIARGMSPEEAHRTAQRRLGNTTVIREEIYRMNSLGWIETLWQDVRFGGRLLRKTPGFTAVAMLSLALGIGATTSIFSAIYGVLVSPYPYARASEIWAPQILDARNPQRAGFRTHQMHDYLEIKKLPAFSEVMATRPDSRLLSGDRPENFRAIGVTPNAFQFLAVPPVLGRTIEPSDVRPDGRPEPVIVLSYKAWERLFDASASALGKRLVLSDEPFTVIGVMPPRFGWFTSDGGWIPLAEDSRDTRPVAAIMRLKPGVSPQVGEAQLQALHLQLAQQRPNDFPKEGFTSVLNNYLDVTVASGDMESSLHMLFGAVGFLLLIACANVANLQLARGTARAHEIAVRMSIGAGRLRVFRQLLSESVVLAVAGGLLGIVFAKLMTLALLSLMPENYVPNEARIEMNWYVLAFSAGISVVTGIVFGLAPALRCSRPDLVDALKDTGRSLSASGGGRTRQALVVAEIALSVVLLMGASLTVRGFLNLQTIDPGFHTDHVLMLGTPLPPKRYATYQQRIAFADRLLDETSHLPGVLTASIGTGGLPYFGPRSAYAIEGRPRNATDPILFAMISADYPRTLGIPLRAGRGLTAQEISQVAPVALINETAAKLWTGGINPIGSHIHLEMLEKPSGPILVPTPPKPDLAIVGVLADTRNTGRRNPAAAMVYIPYTLAAPNGRSLALRTQGKPTLLLNAVREKLRAIDKDQPLNRPLTLDEILGSEIEQPRFNMAVFVGFGLLGLVLAVIGIYSMLSYNVARRTHEIGVRMALGAASGDVLSLVLISGGRLVLLGLGVGLGASVVLSKVLRSQVFEVPGTDVLAMSAVAVLLSAAALAACVVPARRAAKLDPMIALRRD